ncbi:MAG: helix-turn-helix domain-containing protein [Geobacteraceae bacterium]|nr:helix-turn-helix domain-containing protein [Geobacteraceae bacterium]
MTPFNTDNSSESLDIATLGSWLKAAREERGQSVDDVSKITRIGKNYIEAIEEGAESKLPSQAYTRGFIRLYASHLGFSAEETLAKMNMSSAEPPPAEPSSSAARITISSAKAHYSRAIILVLLLSMTSVCGYLFFKTRSAKKTAEQAPSKATVQPLNNEKSSVAVQPKVATGTPASPLLQSVPKAVDSQGIILRLKAITDGRIHITLDGSISQDYDLVTGDLVEWKAENNFLLDLDNAASVEGELDGVKLGVFGDPGKAAHLLLKADGVHKE